MKVEDYSDLRPGKIVEMAKKGPVVDLPSLSEETEKKGMLGKRRVVVR